jgi:hypothetical protein
MSGPTGRQTGCRAICRSFSTVPRPQSTRPPARGTCPTAVWPSGLRWSWRRSLLSGPELREFRPPFIDFFSAPAILGLGLTGTPTPAALPKVPQDLRRPARPPPCAGAHEKSGASPAWHPGLGDRYTSRSRSHRTTHDRPHESATAPTRLVHSPHQTWRSCTHGNLALARAGRTCADQSWRRRAYGRARRPSSIARSRGRHCGGGLWHRRRHGRRLLERARPLRSGRPRVEGRQIRPRLASSRRVPTEGREPPRRPVRNGYRGRHTNQDRSFP